MADPTFDPTMYPGSVGSGMPGAPTPPTSTGNDPSVSTGGGFDVTKYLPYLLGGAGVATNLIGANMASNQMNQANQIAQQNAAKLWAAYGQQNAQRNAMLNSFMPSLLNHMGLKQQAANFPQFSTQGLATNPTTGGTVPSTSTAPMPTSIPGAQPSSAAKGLGMAGLGAGLAAIPAGIGGASGLGGSALGAGLGALGVGGSIASAAIPFVGPALALGSVLAGQIGAGRRAANSFVQQVQNPFGQQLAQIVKEKDAGQTQQAQQDFSTDYQNFLNEAHKWQGAGGKEALVANQALDPQKSPQLQQTIQTLAQQLGVNLNQFA